MDQLAALGYAYNPCLTNLSNVLCVGATDPYDILTSFSTYGLNTVHLAAPGLAIASTMKSEMRRNVAFFQHTYLISTLFHPTLPVVRTDESYATLTGTSMAAPMVSGIAALALSLLGAAEGNYYQVRWGGDKLGWCKSS